MVTPPLDGSYSNDRYPKVSLVIEDAGGRPVKPKGPGKWCGNVNSFARRDFVELGDGQALTFQIGGEDFDLTPGEYRARFSYVSKREAGRARVGRGARGQFDRMWEGTLVSNWLRFTVAK